MSSETPVAILKTYSHHVNKISLNSVVLKIWPANHFQKLNFQLFSSGLICCSITAASTIATTKTTLFMNAVSWTTKLANLEIWRIRPKITSTIPTLHN